MCLKIRKKVNGHNSHAIMWSLYKEYVDMEHSLKDLSFNSNIISKNLIKRFILHMEFLIRTQNYKIL